MSDPIPPPPAPLVTVTLPGGAQVRGRLTAREQGADGGWTYTVTLPVPAAACEPVAGEDYGRVPTTRADESAGGWLFERLPGGGNDPRVTLHTAICWVADRRKSRAATTDNAREFIRHQWAVPCSECRPKP